MVKKAKVFEIPTLRNKTYIFRDRDEAAEVLARMLEPYYKEAPDTVVMGIPSGGVPIAVGISRQLHLPLDLFIVRKIQIPGNPEAGMGALSFAGGLFLNQQLIDRLGITPRQVEEQIQRVRKELAMRNELFRQGRPIPDLSSKTVIIADDGLASGFTTLAAIRGVRSQGAQKVVVAAPTGSDTAIERLSADADEIFCPNIRSGYYFAVAEAYQNWYDLEPQEVISRLQEAGYLNESEGWNKAAA